MGHCNRLPCLTTQTLPNEGTDFTHALNGVWGCLTTQTVSNEGTDFTHALNGVWGCLTTQTVSSKQNIPSFFFFKEPKGPTVLYVETSGSQQPHRSESPNVVITRHASKYKVNKPQQGDEHLKK